MLPSQIPLRLRLGLDRRLAGFCLINGVTFAVDVALLSLLHGVLHWPLPASVTLAYAVAFALSYVLNRQFNFHSHGDVGGQLRLYVPVVMANYLLFLLGLTELLAAAGLDYRLARLLAGGGEGVFMYAALRWMVFRDAQPVRR